RGFGVGREIEEPIQYASAATEDDDDGTAVAYTAVVAAQPVPTSVTPAPSEVRYAAPVQRAEVRATDLTASLNGASSAPPPPRPAPRTPAREASQPAAGGWAVQVGAFREETVARDWLAEVQRRFRSQFGAADRTVQNAEGWYRSRFTGMTEQAAQAACSALSERRVTCMVIRPQG
ncbi:MAG TPA: SPOR domain-containing protein, partial [Brevundimonas sp.]|nr:SPOR domain-containing protein [Brevundimonas sp.]